MKAIIIFLVLTAPSLVMAGHYYKPLPSFPCETRRHYDYYYDYYTYRRPYEYYLENMMRGRNNPSLPSYTEPQGTVKSFPIYRYVR